MKRYISLILLFFIFSIGIVNAEETLFEGIGHYAFATAGTNFAYRGDNVETLTNRKFIFDSPKDNSEIKYDWDKVYSKIKVDGYELTNLTGSYLNINGILKKVILTSISPTINWAAYNGRILIIKPNGEYFIYNKTSASKNDDITAYLSDNESGWYYVSYLDARLLGQSAWSITAVYENNELPNKYLKFINVDYSLGKGESKTIDFSTSLANLNKFQIIGVIAFAGSSAFHVKDGMAESLVGDKAYAVLENGSEYQLYDRGDGHFTGRSNLDFACAVYSTKKSTNLAGGELDIFDETLSTNDYFNGKQLKSIKFTKSGTDWYIISLLGIAQEIESLDFKIESNITINSNTKTTNTVKLTNNSKYSGSNTILKIKYDESYTSITDITLSNDKATYTIEEGYINITIPDEFKSNEELTVTFIGNGTFSNNQEINLESEASSYPTILKKDSISYDIEKYKLSISDKTNAIYTELIESVNEEEPVTNPETSTEDKIIITISILTIVLITYLILNKKNIIRRKIV